jgi:Undecaprenyl-phosphate galactose phosphotransferase WbaP
MDAMILVSRPEISPRLTRFAKRAFDISISLLALALLAIPMLIIAAIVSLDGSSPIFGHSRIGMNGRKFKCLKLRSMHVDGDAILKQVLETSDEARAEWTQSQKLKNDPRVTRIGNFIRKTSIDELPQLINVLKGDMSLIGPRPVTEKELDQYGEARSQYMAVRPGVTGLWQVSGRSDLSYERRVELDSWYVENWSPWHDIAILAKTFPVVLGRSGAY